MKIAVIGLGYVGLPLALELAKYFEVTGFDVSATRIDELGNGIDRTGEVDEQDLRVSSLSVTVDPDDIAGSDIFIVTVPTPINETSDPDLSALLASSATVGKILSKGAIVVFESTVYPGVTEDICGPALEKASGLTCGEDFFLGYSPERINPGDKMHRIDTVTKIVAGQTPEATETLMKIYNAVTNGNAFQATDIRTAEAAKVIENAQRDINIAFINEVSMIFNKAGISTRDVLEAANTKWNFLPFTPGLVGGHCIGVDPFYLAHLSRQLGHDPEIILAGRRINDGMARFIANSINSRMEGDSRDILVLGLTFKENVPDLRNSKVADLINHLSASGHRVLVHDAHADKDEAHEEYGITLLDDLNLDAPVDCIVGAVSHDTYRDFGADVLNTLVIPTGLVADLKGMWSGLNLASGIKRWNL